MSARRDSRYCILAPFPSFLTSFVLCSLRMSEWAHWRDRQGRWTSCDWFLLRCSCHRRRSRCWCSSCCRRGCSGCTSRRSGSGGCCSCWRSSCQGFCTLFKVVRSDIASVFAPCIINLNWIEWNLTKSFHRAYYPPKSIHLFFSVGQGRERKENEFSNRWTRII